MQLIHRLPYGFWPGLKGGFFRRLIEHNHKLNKCHCILSILYSFHMFHLCFVVWLCLTQIVNFFLPSLSLLVLLKFCHLLSSSFTKHIDSMLLSFFTFFFFFFFCQLGMQTDKQNLRFMLQGGIVKLVVQTNSTRKKSCQDGE